MKSKILILFLLIGTYNTATAQTSKRDSLLNELAVARLDSNRVLIMTDLCTYYRSRNTDSSRIYGQKALNLAQQINFAKGEVWALVRLGTTIWILGDIPEALNLEFKGLQIAKEKHFQYETAWCLSGIGTIYGWGLNDHIKALTYLNEAMHVIETSNPNSDALGLINSISLHLGISYIQLNQPDSALFYLQKVINTSSLNDTRYTAATMFMGELQFLMGNRQLAIDYLQKSMEVFMLKKQNRGLSESYNIYAGFFNKMNQPDSAIYYAKKGLAHAQSISFKQEILVSSNLLSELYKSKDINEAYKYLSISKTINAELYGAQKVQSLQKLVSEEQERQRKIEIENIAIQNRVQRLWIFSISGALLSALLVAFILYRTNKNKQKANAQLKRQKAKVEGTLEKLKATQSQLIQSEKMASLGELTAGIAHEIQNPLNFVNNFSEVSRELIIEMKEEITNKNYDDVKEISQDIDNNLEKINHHGKRAESIVRGMLQHSRTNSGDKELTDLNKLADEYLRLSYHGLRAKDKSFNADFKTEFDKTLAKTNVVPQDIGRVLLNLINNAFYAVDKKAKEKIEGYKPMVIVSTETANNEVKILVKDNGQGIPTEIKDKIFQPFFTTKPTGSGTGLGLSLSYDIVKAHGGKISVNSKENEGSEFVILIPIIS